MTAAASAALADRTTATASSAVRVRVVLGVGLTPGASVPVAVTVSNPNSAPWPLAGVALAGMRTSVPGCWVSWFAYKPPVRLPRVIPGHGTVRLVDGGRLRFRDQPVNQDACRGARVSVRLVARSAG